MNLKKIVTSLFLLAFCFAVVAEAGVSSNKKNKNTSSKQQTSVAQVKVKGNPHKQYVKAKKAYFNNDIATAELYIEKILNSWNDEKAYDLKNKILLLNEKMSFIKKNLVNDYMVELRKTVREGNFYEGLMYIKRISEIDPEEDLSTYKMKLDADRRAIEDFLEEKSDKNIFKKSVNKFVDGDYLKAKDYIEKLAEKYPRFATFNAVANTYIISENNAAKANSYYKEALSYVKKHRLPEAKNFIDFAYCVAPKDIKILTLMEQISLEMLQ